MRPKIETGSGSGNNADGLVRSSQFGRWVLWECPLLWNFFLYGRIRVARWVGVPTDASGAQFTASPRHDAKLALR